MAGDKTSDRIWKQKAKLEQTSTSKEDIFNAENWKAHAT